MNFPPKPQKAAKNPSPCLFTGWDFCYNQNNTVICSGKEIP